jgi:hypothetical protein
VTRPIPSSPSALLALAALACCGPKKAAESDADAGSDGDPTGTPVTTGVEPAEACALVPDPGPCEAAFDRYFFNQQTGRCEVFTYGGCDGVVPFDDFAACQNACDPCEEFLAWSEPPSQFPPVEVAVRNDTAAPIYLRAWAPDDFDFRWTTFTVSPAGGTPLQVGDGCDFACAETQFAGCYLYCTDLGPLPAPIFIAPGGVYRAQWGGQYIGQVDLPAHCLSPDCRPLTCGRWLDAAPGPYEIGVAATTTWPCEPDCCTPNADGWCEFVNGQEYVEPYPLELTVPFTFPGGPVELAFQ